MSSLVCLVSTDKGRPTECCLHAMNLTSNIDLALYSSDATRVSLFRGFSTSRETENFQKKYSKIPGNYRDPENSRESRDSGNSREIFPGIFLELDCIAIFFLFSVVLF